MPRDQLVRQLPAARRPADYRKPLFRPKPGGNAEDFMSAMRQQWIFHPNLSPVWMTFLTATLMRRAFN
jgi:hypothetical protein